ncbi:MAG: hypothetical protein AB1489_17135, partial [Acidobacteriota bacterium]
MKKFVIVIYVLLLVNIVGCQIQGVAGSGNIKNEKRDVAPFTSVEVSGAYEVEIVGQQSQSL